MNKMQMLNSMRHELDAMAERESTMLYRLAWRARRHGCSEELVLAIQAEARELHFYGYPERLIEYGYTEHHFRFAFHF